MHQTLLVIRHGRTQSIHTERLRDGAAGNLRTLVFVRQMVREDAALNLELRRRAQELIADCPAEDFDCEVQTIFEYAQRIRFVRDPIDVERIADALTTIVEGQGDCVDKCILLASLLGSVGHLTRGEVVNFYGDVDQHGFDHFYLEVQRTDGSWQPLDPTPENVPPGWEVTAAVHRNVDLWDGTSGPVGSGISGLLDQILPGLIQQGVQLGSQWAASTQRPQPGEAQERQIGQAFDSLAAQVTAFFDEIQRRPAITAADLAAATQAYQQLAAAAQQYSGVEYVSRMWASSAYRPAYETRLQQIAARASQTSTPVVGNDGNVTPVATTPGIGGLTSNPLFWPLVALVAITVLPGLLSRD